MLLVLGAAFSAGADDPAVRVPLHVDLALFAAAGEGAGGELLDEASVVIAQPWSTATRGAKLAEETMSVGFSPGWRKTGTMIRAILVEPSLLGRSARPN